MKRTVYNQYDAIVRPLASWLEKQGVQFVKGTRVTDMEFAEDSGKLSVKLRYLTFASGGIGIMVEMSRELKPFGSFILSHLFFNDVVSGSGLAYVSANICARCRRL